MSRFESAEMEQALEQYDAIWRDAPNPRARLEALDVSVDDFHTLWRGITAGVDAIEGETGKRRPPSIDALLLGLGVGIQIGQGRAARTEA